MGEYVVIIMFSISLFLGISVYALIEGVFRYKYEHISKEEFKEGYSKPSTYALLIALLLAGVIIGGIIKHKASEELKFDDMLIALGEEVNEC